MLVVENVSKRFGGLQALSGVSCSLKQREIACLIGPNGAGKTTLFNVITGFTLAESGRVTLGGSDLLNLPVHRIAAAGISRTFQDLRLIRRLSVLENVMLAFPNQTGEFLLGVFLRSRAVSRNEIANRETALSLLERVGLTEKAQDASEDLSYGQQKLLSLACCLAMDADLLLLDEPVAGVSPVLTGRIMDLIRGLPEQGKTVLMIEHNLDAAASVCDRMIFMNAGRVVSEGTPETVRNDPQVINAYVQ